MAKISIFRDGVWAGDGRIDQYGAIECSAVLGKDQDASDETYEAIQAEIGEEPEGMVQRPDGVYTWTIEE